MGRYLKVLKYNSKAIKTSFLSSEKWKGLYITQPFRNT